MNWGVWGNDFDSYKMESLLEKTLEIGINTFDHADIYGGYTTETTFGTAFKNSQIERETLRFISKCGIQFPCEERPLPVKHYNYSQAHIRMSVENSLRRLNTEYLDVLLLHRPSPLMHAETIARVIQDLQQEGKIIELGVSNFTPSQIELLQQELTLTWNQIECSLTHEQPLFNGTLDYMKAQSIGAMSWSPLGSYYKKNSVKIDRISKCISPLCEKYTCSKDQLLLAWLLHHPSKISPVVGTTSVKRLKASQEALLINLEIIDWFLMLEASMGKPLP